MDFTFLIPKSRLCPFGQGAFPIPMGKSFPELKDNRQLIEMLVKEEEHFLF